MATKRKLSEFEQAFADARADGRKEFTFKGKKFHTRTAEEDRPKAKALTGDELSAVSGGGRGKQSGASAEDFAAVGGGRGKQSGASAGDFAAVGGGRGKSRGASAEDFADVGGGRGKQSGATAENFSLPYVNRPSADADTDTDMPTFAKGGSASSRADGIAKRGKTRGKIC